MEEIAERSKACDLCKMLYQSAKEAGLSDSDDLQCRRVESTVMIEPHGAALLSIYADPKNSGFQEVHTQIGRPQLSQPLSDFQITLFKEWLRVCDEEHNHQFESEVELPTRVLDVGTNENPILRLHEKQRSTFGQYVALSHCWGTGQHFKTLKSNIDKFRQCIDFEELPRTFKEAIEVTRKLKFRYLWIDSLCIIQDDPTDWEREAASMEHVFSSASITIAASSARSSSEGFLPTRKEQQSFLAIKAPSGGTLFIRKSIDNFRRDVEESALNQRGWVLQERALARRIIHFTSSQVYWECGLGVHCETLMKLRNRRAAFLGDSDFPNSALAYFKGARILLFQSLYQTYSTLGFSHVPDRSTAIRGLEERLLKAFGSKGGFGAKVNVATVFPIIEIIEIIPATFKPFDNKESMMANKKSFQRSPHADDVPTIRVISDSTNNRLVQYAEFNSRDVRQGSVYGTEVSGAKKYTDSGYSENISAADIDHRTTYLLRIPILTARVVANCMRSSFEKSSSNGQYFLPYNSLCGIITFDVVSRLLQNAFESLDTSTIANLAAEVVGHSHDSKIQPEYTRRRIFAILVMMDKVSAIHDFIDNNVIMDNDLPLKVERQKVSDYEATVKLCQSYQSDDLESDDVLSPLNLSTCWSFNDMEEFELRQKTMCIQQFELPCKKIQFYNLRHRPTLPFLTYKRHKVGGYGTVWKGKLHDAHCNHVESCESERSTRRVFAVKELHTESEKAYKQEMELFVKIGARSENEHTRHLIQLQFSYLYGDRYFLVFPWADGNLREFWAKYPEYHLKNDKDLVWFFRQCKGLAKGLKIVHTLTSFSGASKADLETVVSDIKQGKLKKWGRHGDIKPENILWFENYEDKKDFLVISDFGLTSFNTTNSRSKVRAGSIAGYSGTYRPPELDLRGDISQSYDIWSLGCVYLEFVSWFLLGYRETQSGFTDSRINGGHVKEHANNFREDTFFTIQESSGGTYAEINPSVVVWIEKLRAHAGCTEELRAFLDYIQSDMLQPNPTARPICEHIMGKFTGILKILETFQNKAGGDNQNKSSMQSSASDPILRASRLPFVYPETIQPLSKAISLQETAPTSSRKRSDTSTSPTSISPKTDAVTTGSPSCLPSDATPLPTQEESLAEVGSGFTSISTSVDVENPTVHATNLSSEELDPAAD
ncbi:Proline-rich receptor-like protein kinase PERK9 [Colletotrichum siamense]|uniref:Proline-rich receptor-like protein kinase PERK9 n=1 Tax=Colletotrichum siamense TaxID=690259 RepID=A0A9P5F145_COLSI|nr:Proline-rich receptor-like protein kinase PERK9 [Colletotrichum siamense]